MIEITRVLSRSFTFFLFLPPFHIRHHLLTFSIIYLFNKCVVYLCSLFPLTECKLHEGSDTCIPGYIPSSWNCLFLSFGCSKNRACSPWEALQEEESNESMTLLSGRVRVLHAHLLTSEWSVTQAKYWQRPWVSHSHLSKLQLSYL